jgi:hypothetical protein
MSGYDAPTHPSTMPRHTTQTVGCAQNSLTCCNDPPIEEYPQVKSGSTHSRSEAVWLRSRIPPDTSFTQGSVRLGALRR